METKNNGEKKHGKKLTAAYDCPKCGMKIELPYTDPEKKLENFVRQIYLQLERDKYPCWRCREVKKGQQ